MGVVGGAFDNNSSHLHSNGFSLNGAALDLNGSRWNRLEKCSVFSNLLTLDHETNKNPF